MRALARLVQGRPRGAAAVEFAIVLPALLLLLLGTIDWGYYFFIREAVVNASREGARAGSVARVGTDPLPDARAAVTRYVTIAGLDPARVTVTASTGASSVLVEVTCPVGSVTGLLGGVLPANVVARAEMRR